MKTVLFSFIALIGCFMASSCSSSKDKNCGCCDGCDRAEIQQKEDQCGCCTDCGTGPNA